MKLATNGGDCRPVSMQVEEILRITFKALLTLTVVLDAVAYYGHGSNFVFILINLLKF